MYVSGMFYCGTKKKHFLYQHPASNVGKSSVWIQKRRQSFPFSARIWLILNDDGSNYHFHSRTLQPRWTFFSLFQWRKISIENFLRILFLERPLHSIYVDLKKYSKKILSSPKDNKTNSNSFTPFSAHLCLHFIFRRHFSNSLFYISTSFYLSVSTFFVLYVLCAICIV